MPTVTPTGADVIHELTEAAAAGRPMLLCPAYLVQVTALAHAD